MYIPGLSHPGRVLQTKRGDVRMIKQVTTFCYSFSCIDIFTCHTVLVYHFFCSNYCEKCNTSSIVIPLAYSAYTRGYVPFGTSKPCHECLRYSRCLGLGSGHKQKIWHQAQCLMPYFLYALDVLICSSCTSIVDHTHKYHRVWYLRDIDVCPLKGFTNSFYKDLPCFISTLFLNTY